MARKRSYPRWVFGTLAVYTLVGFFLLPVIVKPVLIRQVKKQLHRDATIRRVTVNPYSLAVGIDGLQIAEVDGTGKFLAWERLYVNLQLASLFQRAIVLREVSLSNAYAHVAIRPDHSFNFTDLLPPPSTNPPGALPAIRIARLKISDAQFAYDDFSRGEHFAKTFGPVNVTVQDFSTHPDNQMPYAFTATTEAGESFAWRGEFHLHPVRSHGEFAVEQIALPQFAPYLELFPHLDIRAGRLGVRGSYRVDLTPGAIAAVLSNTVVTLQDLRLAERGVTNDAIAIASLTLTDVWADLLALRSEIGSIQFAGERVHVAFAADYSPNLLKLFETVPPPADAPVTPPRNITVHVHTLTSTNGAATLTGLLGDQTVQWQNIALTNLHLQTAPLMASVAGVTLTNAALTHTDTTVHPTARLNIQQIHAAIAGFSLDPADTTTFHITAKVNNVAPVELTGRLTPISLQQADIKIRGTDFSLLATDPYVGKFLGYRLDSGSLSLDLQYAIHQRQLTAQNNITLDRLNLGDATGSTNALRLPVKLGLAILKDRHGVIALDVPITGSFDSPEFKLRKVILQTFQNLFLRVLTSPFAALGSLFGGGGEELGFQEFLPGQATLQPGEAKKLDTLIRALQERPALQLEIRGSFDNDADLAGLRRLKLEQLLATTSLRDLYLANLSKLQTTFITTNAPPAADTTGFSNIRGITPKNAPARTTNVAVPATRRDAAQVLPEEMERQLLEIMEVAAPDLEQLANTRATVIRDYLLQTGQLEPDRLTVVAPTRQATRAILTLK